VSSENGSADSDDLLVKRCILMPVHVLFGCPAFPNFNGGVISPKPLFWGGNKEFELE
jgi:hypothetical protein